MRGPVDSDRLTGRVVAAFGAGGAADGIGIGQAAALAYAAAGARVAVVDALIGRARNTVAAIGDDAVAIEADVTDEASVAAAIAAIDAEFGRIDVLHNNVGVPVTRAFETFTSADWHRGMAVNCIGAALAMRHAMPHLLAARGAIVNVSSVAAIRHPGIDYAIYAAAKAALDQLTVAVALEFAGRGVRANAILPGLIDTAMGRTLHPSDDLATRDRRSPTGVQGDAWDVANAAVFLASDEARYINAHLLVVDGGLSRRC